MANFDYRTYVQSQVSASDWQRLQAMGIDLSRDFNRILLDFVNFEERRISEIPFLCKQLAEYRQPRVLDSCLGSGATTLGLKLAGIPDVISNELDKDSVIEAKTEADRLGLRLDTVSYDWRDRAGLSSLGGFDAVLCLGNSLTYLFKQEDQLAALSNFHSALKPEGKLIIDQRNYDEILKGRFKRSGKIVYCGLDKVLPSPIYLSQTMVIMEYTHLKSQERFHLPLYPFKSGEMKELIELAGFAYSTAYGDYKKEFDPAEVEFITYVCKKIV